jgi:Tol biopolymer transport system component
MASNPSATALGAVTGTAAYMSPEQARGEQTDERTDIWAFGCLVYELLCGTPAFTNATTAETIAAILDAEPDWSRLPADTPASVRRLLKRSLRKDRAHRLHDIRDARIEIDEALSASPSDTDGASSRQHRAGSWLLATGLVLASTLAAIQSVRLWRQPPAPLPAFETRFEIAGTLVLGEPRQLVSVAISPDGLKIVYAGAVDGRAQLFLRDLDSVTTRPLPGTDGAVNPFWSPDGKSVGFFADSELKRIDIEGGTVRSLARAPFGVGGAWTGDGTILFTPLFSGPIYRIRATGGEATVLTQLASGDIVHRPLQFLPDGRRFLYAAGSDPSGGRIYVGDLDGSQPRRIVDGELAVLHLSSNRILFVRQGTLFWQSVDPAAMTVIGEPVPMAERVAGVSASAAGPLVYRTRPPENRRQFVWFDRSGRELGRVGNPDVVRSGEATLSPDGRHVSLTRVVNGNSDIWLLDTLRGVLTRVTSEPAANWSLRWSPDGKRVAFDSTRSGVGDLYVKSSTGTGNEELLLATPQNKSVTDWSPDGRHLLFRTVDPVTSHDLWALPLAGDRQPFPVVRTDFVEAFGQFSPDSRWIAYQSNESGRFEVYVQPFPGPGPKQRISTNGGGQMRWRRDGRELFYLDLDSRMMAVSIESIRNGEALEAGTPVPLFTARVDAVVPLQSGYNLSYVVTPDGQRFLMNTVIDEPATAPMTVILNWNIAR